MARLRRLFPVLVCFGITAIVAMVFLHSVDLKPQVGENFFFAKNDPQVRSDNEISRTLPGEMTEILGRRCAWSVESVLVQFQIHSLPSKCDTFHQQTEALLCGPFQAQFDLAAGSHDTLPRNSISWLATQEASDRPVIQRITGGCGNLAVGCHSSFGYGKDDTPKSSIPQFIGMRTADRRARFRLRGF